MYIVKRNDQYWNADEGSFTISQRDATRFADKTADLTVLSPRANGAPARYVKLAPRHRSAYAPD